MFEGRSVGVVIPAFNEGGLITDTLRSIPGYVDSIYVVDDGSQDQTADRIMTFGDRRITLLQHSTNKGVGAAILTGYRRSIADNLDIVVVMAGDNQMDPVHLPRLLSPVIEGRADYAKGNRLTDPAHLDGMSGWRYFGNSVLSLMTKIASGYWRVSDSQNGYTAISREALLSIIDHQIFPYYGYCNDILIKLGTNGKTVIDVPMPAKYGSEKSKIRYSRYIVRVGPMIVRGGVQRYKKRLLS